MGAPPGVLATEEEIADLTRSRYHGELDASSKVRPGEHWSVPIEDEHPELSFTTRATLKSLADTGPKTLQKNLENEGFEARHRGGMNFSIRKPGEKKWYVVDPSIFEPLDDTLELLGSIAPAVAGQLYGGAKGAAIGGVTLGPVGAVGGGIVGAAGGATAGEAAKMGLGKLAGIEYVPEEVTRRLGTEAVIGGGAQALGPALRAGGELIKGGASRTAAGVGQLGKKYQAARDVRTIAEGPRTKIRQEFAGGAEDLIKKAFSQVEEMPISELTKRSKSLQQKISAESAKGAPIEALEQQLKLVDDAIGVEDALKQAGKAGDVTALQTEGLSKDSFVRQIAEDAGIPTFGKTYDKVVSALDEGLTDKRFQEYLATGQDPAVKEAIERQMGNLIDVITPQEFVNRELAEMGALQRAVVSPPDLLRNLARGSQRLRKGTAKGLEKAGTVAGLPGKAFDAASKKFRDIITPGMKAEQGGGLIGPFSGLGLGYAVGMGPQVAAGIMTGIGSKIAEAGLKGMSRTIMKDPRQLMVLMRKATGAVATKMEKPLQVLQRRGESAYKAAVFTMLHDPEVRNYLQGLEKKKDE